jgi:SP family arabinose:H+ symporter-like MFS transporter
MTAVRHTSTNESNSFTYIGLICSTAALGGFLFGFDTAVISGCIGYLEKQFALSSWTKGAVVSSALIGCIVGAIIAGWLSDRWGRKRMLVAAAVLFLVSAIASTWPPNVSALVFARWIGGVGVGIASMLSPLYISEICPPSIRGTMVALYQLAITVGILAAYFSNASIDFVSQNWNVGDVSERLGFLFVAEPWRGMFLSLALPSAGFLALLFFVPESPRWLMQAERAEEAERIIQRISGPLEAAKQIDELRTAVTQDQGSFFELFTSRYRSAMLIGFFLPLFGQVSGINAIIYYGPDVLEQAGFRLSESLGGQVVIGIVNMLFTFVAIFTVDRWGRRPLIIFGSFGVILSLFCVGLMFHFEVTSGWMVLIPILTFIACFAFSLGPLPWIVISEIFPTRVRGRAMSVGTFAVWGGCFLVAQTFPSLLESIGPSYTFWLYAVLVAPVIPMTIWLLPETKGRSLEQIEQSWHS